MVSFLERLVLRVVLFLVDRSRSGCVAILTTLGAGSGGGSGGSGGGGCVAIDLFVHEFHAFEVELLFQLRQEGLFPLFQEEEHVFGQGNICSLLYVPLEYCELKLEISWEGHRRGSRRYTISYVIASLLNLFM